MSINIDIVTNTDELAEVKEICAKRKWECYVAMSGMVLLAKVTRAGDSNDVVTACTAESVTELIDKLVFSVKALDKAAA